MSEKPILFSGPMVRAILDGSKTQTRRVLSPQPYIDPKWGLCWRPKGENHPTGSPWYCERNGNWNPITNAFADFWRDRGGSPYGAVSDQLWVRETWRADDYAPKDPEHTIYRADMPADAQKETESVILWKPSIFMSRNRSRLTLEITGVRVERVQDISEADAVAEGITPVHPGERKWRTTPLAKERYAVLWNSINATRGFGWDTNPFVWVVSFRRVPQPTALPQPAAA